MCPLIFTIADTSAQQLRGRAQVPTWNFETGDLSGWTLTGNAFQFQPTLDDNPTARKRGQPSNHQGRYWIGTYERYAGRQGQRVGDVQGDEPQGTLTSAPFRIPGQTITFLVSGGSSFQTRVELLVTLDPIEGTARVLWDSGRDNETMRRVMWDVSKWAGRTARIRIVDESSGPWGHINADDFVFTSPLPAPPQTQIPTVTLGVDRPTITAGESALVSYSSTNATAVTIQPGIGAVKPVEGGRLRVRPTSTTTYTATATGPGGTATPATVTITVNRAPPPPQTQVPTVTLGVDRPTITAGESAVVSYSSSNATAVTIQPGIGTVKPVEGGRLRLRPTSTTTYTATATGPGGTATPATVTITVNARTPLWPFILAGLVAAGFVAYRSLFPAKPTFRAVPPERIDSNLLTPLRIDFKVIAAPEVERGYHRVDKLMIVRTRRVRGANG
jgi:hypothetical protein